MSMRDLLRLCEAQSRLISDPAVTWPVGGLTREERRQATADVAATSHLV